MHEWTTEIFVTCEGAVRSQSLHFPLARRHQLLISFFFLLQLDIFFLFFTKTYVVGTHYKHLAESLLMSIRNKCFLRRVKKKYYHYENMPI